MPSESTLTLFIPDLFGFQSTLNNLSSEEKSSLPEIKTPVLEKWLSRGLLEKATHQEDIIFSELGFDRMSDKPLAALSLLAEEMDLEFDESTYWLRADPVNLQPDRDTALLAGHEELALTQEESDKLVTQINEHFNDEPWQLYTFAPHRWYLRLDKPADLVTTPLNKVLGQDINPFAPQGDDADYWFKIINELQMLIHGSIVNFERESRNMWTANSIWLWGGGCLPAANVNSSYDKIVTNNRVFSGIGHHCGLDVIALKNLFPLDSFFSKIIKENNTFVVLDTLSEQVRRRDLYTFVQTLNALENDFLISCHKLLLNGTLAKIKLMTDAGTFIITKKSMKRWWKRIKSFSDQNYE